MAAPRLDRWPLMPATERDLEALAYLARRLREETYGAGQWDAQGVHAVFSKLVGRNLAITCEQVIRNAIDPDAKTPGAVNRPFLPPAPSERPREAARPPKRGEHCLTCGLHLDRCACGEHRTRPEPAGDWRRGSDAGRIAAGLRPKHTQETTQ